MASSASVIHSARLVSDGRVTTDAWVAFQDGTISATGVGDGWRSRASADRGAGAPREETVIDARGRWLTPGFIDIHCHGAGGAAFDDDDGAITTALAVHRRHGTTRSVLSLVTAGQTALEERLARVARAAAADPLVLGAHLEGPFLDPDFRGAHDPALLRVPDPESVSRLVAAANGSLRQVTLAPELPGADRAIDAFMAAGIAVAVGHTGADYATALSAFERGASILTHAFNGMRGIHHRAPGPVAAALHTSHVTLEVINDGVHVHPEVVRLAFSGAPGRVALVTDAMAATDAPDGAYRLGTLPVTVADGIARVTDGGAIAGSTLTQDEALRRAVEAGVSIEAAVTALTETPARAIGRSSDLGRLAPGFAADLVLLGSDLTVEAVIADGRRLA